MLRSVQEVYDYVSNINIYLNGYDRYYSSENGIQTINGDEYWLKECQEVEPETETLIMHHEYEEYRNTKRELTVYQRMLLMDGFVIMNIDLQAYENILRQAVGDTEMTILFVNSQQDLVIAYQDTVNIDSENLSRITQKEDTSNWITINHQRYLIQKIYDEQCNLELIALLPQVAIFKELSSIYPIYFIVFALNTMIVIALAYITTKRNFSHLDDMIQIFSNAEKEIYLPVETTSPARDEYDILMKNIIYLFLQKVRLDKELETQKEEERIAEITALQAQINPHFCLIRCKVFSLKFVKRKEMTAKLQRSRRN